MVQPFGSSFAGFNPSTSSLGQRQPAAQTQTALFGEGFGEPAPGATEPDMFTLMGMLMTSVAMMMTMVLSTLMNRGFSGQPAAPSQSEGMESGGDADSSDDGPSETGNGVSSGTATANSAGGGNFPGIPGTDTAPRRSGSGNGRPQVIIEGDSLSTSNGGSFTYADQLARRMNGQADFVFKATSGDRLAGGIGNDAAANANGFDPSRRDNVVVLWGGTNDLHGGASGQQTYDKLVQAAQKYKYKGFKVVVLTSIQLGANHTGEDDQRRIFNDRIRQGGPWDAVVDVASMPEFSDTNDAAAANRQYYAADGVHLTGAGYGLISQKVEQTLQRLLG